MIANRPRTFAEVDGAIDGFLWLGHPGPFGPQALAEILAGEVNPSGRLPFTYPRYPNALVTYDRKGSENDGSIDPPDAWVPMFEFGGGLGYAPFEYSGLTVAESGRGRSGGLSVSVTVTNTGDRSGQEVVQVYVTDEFASVTPPLKRLKAFEKIELAAGASRRVSFSLSRADLSHSDSKGRLVFEPGSFVISVGGQRERVVVD
jgi:beta-glucosidase